MKKILFIGNLKSVHTIKWINFFANEFNVSIISNENPYDNSLINPKIKIYIYNKFSNKIFNIIYTICKLILNHKSFKNLDFIHVHYLGFNMILALLFKSKIISTVYGSDIKINSSNILKKFFIKKFLHNSQLITTDSFEIQKYLINKFNIIKEKINIINFGIDTEFFIKKKYNTNLSKKYNLTNKTTSIVCLRGHEKIYDLKTLIKGVDIASKKIDLRCLIFNEGPETKEYKKISNQLGLNNIISFHGKYSQNDLPEIFSVCDAYVSSSLSDGGIAASTAEAMSCELTPIITNNSDNSYWISNNINGFLFEDKNYEELANIILNLKNFNTIEIGKKARQKIIDKNDYKNEMFKMRNIYNNIA